MTCPLRAPRAYLCSTKNANKMKKDDALLAGYENAMKKIPWDDGSGVHNKTLFRASPFFFVGLLYETNFHFFRLSAQLVMKISI